jgi:urea carboxylase-associated protein 2
MTLSSFDPRSPDPESRTATLDGARSHARRQADQATVAPLPGGVASDTLVWDDIIGSGDYASCMLARGTVLRIRDDEGDACVQLLVYNASRPAERLNVADTLKVQWQAYLGAGALLLSDMGRALMTIVDDTSARHDCLCGCSNRRGNDSRYGNGAAWGTTPNARDLFALAAAKHGLGRIDIGPNLNLFKGVVVRNDGSLAFDGDPAPERHVDLRAEMDVLVLLVNTPHPLDFRSTYTTTPAHATAWRTGGGEAGPALTTTPERARALENTTAYLRGISP